MDSNGKKAIRAYETMGSSKRGLTTPPNNRKYPKWKLFLYDNIVSWANGKKSFADYKDQLIAQGLKVHGDKHMSTLFAITPFADDDVQVARTSSTNPITPEPVTKLDVNPSPKSQNKATTDKDKFISAGQQRANTVDKTQQTDYTDNKLEAPDTEPISKQQISGQEENPSPENSMEKMTAKTSPITKDEIENGENKDDVMDKFNDLNKRMDNLYNDNEEEDEEDANK